MKPLTPMQAAYIAGFFDGEGHVSVRKDKRWNHALHVTISQKRPAVLHMIHKLCGGSVYENFADGCPRWWIYNRPAAVFMRQIFPYLIVKRAEAHAAVVEFYKTRKHINRWPPKGLLRRRRRQRQS